MELHIVEILVHVIIEIIFHVVNESRKRPACGSIVSDRLP